MRSVALLAAFAASGALAQGTIQKCVGADGKVNYQDTPCEVGKKTTAQIQRDKSTGDPLSIQRAQEERARSLRYSQERAAVNAAEERQRAKEAEAEARAQEREEAEERADARVRMMQQSQQPAGYYAPTPIVIQERVTINNRPAAPAPPPAPRPAPCAGAGCK